MIIEFNRWPLSLEKYYKDSGYWLDLPLYDIIRRHQCNNTIAIICSDHQLTYSELNALSDSCAASLRKMGVKFGQTALVQLNNCCEFYIVFFALLKLGVIPVNALYSHQRHELMAYAEQIKPSLLIADRAHPLFKDSLFIETLREKINPNLLWLLKNDSGTTQNLHSYIFEQSHHFEATPTPADEVAFFQLSGGSTGTPKLIPRTHNDYYYSVRASVEICQFNNNTRYLCALPVSHNYPMSSPGALGVFYASGLVVMASDPSAYSCFPLIKKYQVNVTALIPPAVSLWLEALSIEKDGNLLASLKLLQVGGAKLEENLAKRIPREVGCQLQQVFGMAEGLVNYTRLDDDEQKIFTTQGYPICHDDEVWVSDKQGNALERGMTGLLMTRGPYTFRGYYNSPDYNKTVFDENGFYCTGDLVRITDDGYIQVVGREKDQINRGGEKIASEEIENLLLSHPDIIYTALVAIPDELMGEKSCAFIVTRKEIKAVQLRRYLREQGIADYKLPDRFEVLPSLPTTAVGKIDKKYLRQLAVQMTQNERKEI